MLIKTSFCAQPIISVSPSYTNVQIGDQFDIDINIDYVSHIYGFEIWLSFDKNKLNASSVEYKGFLNEPTQNWHNETNNTSGYIAFAISSRLPATGKTGGSPPPLIAIHFKALSGGNSPLSFIENKTILADDQGIAIPHTTIGGIVHVAGGADDVAVISVTTSKDGCKPMPTVSGDSFVKVNVTVLNQGSYTETDINVTVYANTTSIASQNVTLSSGNSMTLTFTWNTTGFAYGNYTTSAYAWPVPGETNTANNNLTGATIEVTIPGDVNGDGTVNILDAIQVSNSFLATPSSSNWNPNADINSDNVVNILDAIILANHFLQHYP
jgi:hypothetical protein